MTKNSCPECKKSKNFLEILVSKPLLTNGACDLIICPHSYLLIRGIKVFIITLLWEFAIETFDDDAPSGEKRSYFC